MLVGAPRGEHAAGQLESVLAEGLLLGESFAVATKVALQMRPADLPPVRIEMLVAGPAVGDDDPRERADQLVELLAVAVLGDLKQRRVCGGRGPQRTRIAGGPPAGLVDVQRGLAEDPVPQPGVGAGERV